MKRLGELCQKGYSRINEFEAHENSYDHQHKKASHHVAAPAFHASLHTTPPKKHSSESTTYRPPHSASGT
jgi:hypothetical protein